MKKLIFALAVLSLASVTFAGNIAGWESFVIRTAADNSQPAINDISYGTPAQDAKEFVINKGSMKAAWGTDNISGITVGQITELSIDRLDNYARFTAGSGPAVAPYFNMWITNGSGKYAVIANEPSNAEWAGPSKWNVDSWDTLKNKTVKVYENSDVSWLPNAGEGLKFSDLAGFTIQAPTVAELAAGWAGLGTGAPRELGTNKAYAFNWMFGDTLANYVSGDLGYIVANPVAVPEPGTVTVLTICGLVGLAVMRTRRKQRG